MNEKPDPVWSKTDAKEALEAADQELGDAKDKNDEAVTKIASARRQLQRLRSHLQANSFDQLLESSSRRNGSR